MRSTVDVMFSPQLENYKEIGRPKQDKSKVKLSARIVGSPIIVDLEGDGHNELVVAVNYIAKSKNKDSNLHKYLANAIVAFDLMIHQVKWISPLELSAADPFYKAIIMNEPTIVDLDGDGELNIIVGTEMGQIHVLDNFGRRIAIFKI